MNTQALKAKLGGKLSLPSLPEVIVRLQGLVRDPSCGMKDLGEEMASDPPLTARVLRIANSAFYSLRVPILDIRHAAAILGLDTLHTLLMQVGVLEVIDDIEAEQGFDPRELWSHSVLTGQVCASFPERLMRYARKEELYVCGLLHDIGKFVMFDQLGAEYRQVLREAPERGRSLADAEHRAFGFNHAEVGALVAERWGLPGKAIRAIGKHHAAPDHLEAEVELVSIVVLADAVCQQPVGKQQLEIASPLLEAVVEKLTLTPKELEGLMERSAELRMAAAA